MLEFTGKYFNGTSSKPYPCVIRLGGFSLDISYRSDSGETEVVRWDAAQITKTDADFGRTVRLKYGAFPYRMIEVDDERFAVELRHHYPQYAFSRRDMVAVLTGKRKVVMAAFVALLAFGFFAFTVLVPGLGELAAGQVPLSIERSIGDAAYEQLTMLDSEDEAGSLLVQEFFDSIPGRRDYDYTVTVIDSTEENAFAMPGGRIAICSGILDGMERPEELAALLLHESAHVELRHSLKSIFRTLSGYFLISLLFGDTGGITAAVFENLYVFRDLQYSRAMEREADITGLENMRTAGFDPRGMIDLFRSIDDDTTGIMDSGITEFMSTHPHTARRIEYIEEWIAADTVVRYAPLPLHDSLFSKLKQLPRPVDDEMPDGEAEEEPED